MLYDHCTGFPVEKIQSQRLIPRCLEILTYTAIVAADRVNENGNS